MKHRSIDHEIWLDLSEAAEYLGVHFSTLRRWADAGKIPFMRSPGGRRRFALNALAEFVVSRTQAPVENLAIVPTSEPAGIYQPIQERAISYARQSVRDISTTENWIGRLSPEQRARLKGTGHRLMALLLQYNSRIDGGEAFLDEGKRITREYSQVCSLIGLSLPETVHIFLFFRRSILDAIQQTGHLNGSEDTVGQRLYMRTTDYLDALLINLIEGYLAASALIAMP